MERVANRWGGATIADPEDVFISAVNPAGIVSVPSQAELGLAIVSPRRGYEANNVGASPFGIAPGKNWSRQNYFYIPNVGYVSPFGSNNEYAYGIALYANGGLNTNYSANITGSTIGRGPGVFGGSVADVDVKQLFLNLSLAWKINPTVSIGASLLPTLETFIVEGLSPFAPFSIDPSHLSNNHTQTSTGLGVSFGALFNMTRCFRLGLFYQPRISMRKFTRYRGVLPMRGSFDIPATGGIGLSFNPRSDLTLNADIQNFWYNDVSPLSNPNPCRLTGGACLGSNNGSGFGWDNPFALKLGIQWKIEDWALRAGYVHVNRIIPSSQVFFNVFAPALAANEYTVGFSKKISKALRFNLGAMYTPLSTLSGVNQFNPAQNIKIFFRDYEVFGSLTWNLT